MTRILQLVVRSTVSVMLTIFSDFVLVKMIPNQNDTNLRGFR